MPVNHKLKMPQNWLRLEQGERKRQGRPTETRVVKFKGVVDASPFVNKVKPLVNLMFVLTQYPLPSLT